jgi:hypothetical protein
MEKKLLAIIMLVMVASLSVAGCTVSLFGTSSPTPTPTPSIDYSSYYNSQAQANGDLVTPFVKSTNSRGNDVYTGVVSNPDTPSNTWTLAYELTKSEDAANAACNATIAQKMNEGFTPTPALVAALKTEPAFKGYEGIWVGANSTGLGFEVGYGNGAPNWWVFSQQENVASG